MRSPLPVVFAAAIAAVSSVVGQEQGSEIIRVGPDKFLRWHGHAGRTYFVQVSDPNDHLRKWTWAPIIETGNNEDISYEVDGTADNGFFRLWFTDEPTADPDGGDFDSDGLGNLAEVLIHQTNPLEPDTDCDGLPDDWEIANGLDPNDDGSADPANGANGDPDGDCLTNGLEFWHGANPNLNDTDDDGLDDFVEIMIHGTWPNEADGDGDGLDDFSELITYGTDPWIRDTDEDNLEDGSEVHTYHTNPLETDTDGDWMWDDWELAHNLDPTNASDGLLDGDGDTLPNQLEFVFMEKGYNPFSPNSAAIFPWAEDPDLDGLTSQVEFATHLTNPLQHDTDLDGMDDGWEIAHSFNAKLNNLKSGPANHQPGADPDGDGLTNLREGGIGTNPNEKDTDGDGVDDNIEDGQGSNPNDPNDRNPPPQGTVPVNVTFGDDSRSHSEKYRVQLTPLEGDTGGGRHRSNRQFGASQTDTFHLPKGAKYRVELIHIGTDPNYRHTPKPDYDHTLGIATSQGCLVVDDPQHIMGMSDERFGGIFVIEGKSATLYVPLFEWVTPKGSPVTNPDDAGDGQNEFTYSVAAQGVLTMDLKVLVRPTGAAGVTGHDGVKFSDCCFFKLPTINGSTFEWDAANSGGKSTVSGDHLTAKAAYTILPPLNSEFGLKQAEFKCDGDATVLPKADFEVFFPKDGKNHPGGGAGTTPNWFFYWRQFIPPNRIATLNFGGNGYGATNPVTRVTEVGQLSSELNDETNHRGLHTFHETVAHESHHIVLWEGWWGQGGSPTAAEDADGDAYPDSFEGGQAGYGFSVGQNDDYANGVPSTAHNPRWPNESAGYNYEEDLCRQVEHDLNESQFDDKDWSHDPTNTNQGKNHK